MYYDLFRFLFFFSSRRRHTRYWRDWSSDVCSSDLRCAKDEQNLQIKSIYIEPNNLILPINNEVELSVLTDMGTIIDNKKIQWKSSNEDVVIVENGKIKTMKNGEVFITANYQMQKDKEPISAQIKIIVTNLQEFEVERNLDCSIDNLGQKTFFFNVTNKTDKPRSEEHTSELQSRQYLVCRLLLEKKKTNT